MFEQENLADLADRILDSENIVEKVEQHIHDTDLSPSYFYTRTAVSAIGPLSTAGMLYYGLNEGNPEYVEQAVNSLPTSSFLAGTGYLYKKAGDAMKESGQDSITYY